MICNPCEGTGFKNLDQVDEETIKRWETTGDNQIMLDWIKQHPDYDVCVCDCCGNGESWYGTPGEHYHAEDPRGKDGPYAYNGGLAECN